MKGSVLIICVWALVLLTLVCISLAFQVSQTLRIASASLDEVRSYAAARSAIGMAQLCLIQDGRESSQDHLNEIWAKNEAFKKIEIDKENSVLGSIFYENKDGTYYGIREEDGKININKAPESLIRRFLRECGFNEIQSALGAKDIRMWRGAEALDKESENYYKGQLGYECKASDFSVLDELALVKSFYGLDEDILDQIKEGFTTLGTDKININTASEYVLRSLFKAAYDEYLNSIGKLDITEMDAENLARSVLNYRQGGQYFSSDDMDARVIAAKLGLGSVADDPRTKLVKQTISLGWIKADSDNFNIHVRGTAGSVKKDLTVFYIRSQDRLKWYA